MVAIGAQYLLLAVLLAQSSAVTPAAEDKDKAKALLAEGLDFNRQGQHAQALEKFQAAFAAYPSPKLHFNIGQVELALDHPVEAMEAFEKFLALVPDARPEDKKDAKSAVAQLAKKLGRLQIKCETKGAEVAVDGKKVGHVPLPGPQWATPGSHQVTLTHEGFAPATERVEMTTGSIALVVIRLAPPATTPPGLDLSAQSTSAEAASSARPIYKTWWFWTGAAVVVAGAVTTAVVLGSKGGSNVPEAPLGNHGVFK
jgi:tetratricopeptide (TPR) repeat protein